MVIYCIIQSIIHCLKGGAKLMTAGRNQKEQAKKEVR
jgi:hypothetical protein